MTQPAARSFDEKKAAEVAYFFLSKAAALGRHTTKLKFIKWVYLAERMSYERYGEPLVGDKLFSMEHGPVASSTLYLIEDRNKVFGHGSLWEKVVHTERNGRHQYVSIENDCDYRSADDLLSLSDSEIEILEDVWEKYGHLNTHQLETLLHNPKLFPEWRWKRGDGSNPIELEQLLSILGYDQAQTRALIGRLETHEALDQAFAH